MEKVIAILPPHENDGHWVPHRLGGNTIHATPRKTSHSLKPQRHSAIPKRCASRFSPFPHRNRGTSYQPSPVAAAALNIATNAPVAIIPRQNGDTPSRMRLGKALGSQPCSRWRWWPWGDPADQPFPAVRSSRRNAGAKFCRLVSAPRNVQRYCFRCGPLQHQQDTLRQSCEQGLPRSVEPPPGSPRHLLRHQPLRMRDGLLLRGILPASVHRHWPRRCSDRRHLL